jgi:5-methylcytosine-specific restriction endonuclease McrA
MHPREQIGAIRFAELVLQLLDEGRYTATYKYAVLLGLMDLCLECTEASGAPPSMVTTAQLAGKIIDLYWSHTRPFASGPVPTVLRQNKGGQAEILTLIAKFRDRHAPDPSTPHWEARIHAPAGYERLLRAVEWKLIEMPLPRLQMMGGVRVPVLYEIGWDTNIRQATVARYQQGESAAFDNGIRFLPGAGEYLLQLNGLLRPLVQRQWADMVARMNGLAESQLDEHLFGMSRTPTVRVRRGLWEWQGGRCFYCGIGIKDPDAAHVDHFIPWARHSDDSLDNLVLADVRCNLDKKASLAATEHLARWAPRLNPASPEHAHAAELSRSLGWDREPLKNLGVARGIYLRLAPETRLWVRERQFAPPHRERVAEVLRPFSAVPAHSPTGRPST